MNFLKYYYLNKGKEKRSYEESFYKVGGKIREYGNVEIIRIERVRSFEIFKKRMMKRI